MRTFILLALAGLGAQLVDGSLGMAYGVTSTTLLLAFGTNPPAAPATAHLARARHHPPLGAGSLGRASGAPPPPLLLAFGTNPAAASATVHFAEIGTTLMSGASHWKFGNVDWQGVGKGGGPRAG